MGDAIEKVGMVGGALALATWTPEQRELIKRTCARGASDDELQMFLHIAARSGLDPLRRQIHFIKYKDTVTIVADVNGLQARAAREADYEGILHAVVYANDDFAFDNVTGQAVKHTSNPFAAQGKPLGAWAIVHRKGMLPFVSAVRFDEYENTQNPLWRSKPAVMIDKCAKSTALRLAYPEQLGSVYDEAELGKEEREITSTTPPVVKTQPRNANEARAQLQAALSVANGQAATTAPAPKVEAQAAPAAAPIPAPARKRRIVIEDIPPQATNAQPPQVSARQCWDRCLKAASEHNMDAKTVGSELKRLTGKPNWQALTVEDADAFCRWLEDAPPVDDVPPPESEAVPF